MSAVVVTGVSTGIGAATARVLAQRGFRVFGSARRLADTDRLQAEFGASFEPLVFDVTDRPAIDAAARHVGQRLAGRRLAGLVNNAGIVVAGPWIYADADELRRQLEVNVIGQLQVTQAFAGLLGAGTASDASTGPPGRIVMMSSVAGRNASPFLGPYNASKFALEGLSESLRRELMRFGVDVIVVAPGVIATPIWDKAAALDFERLSDSPYGPAIAIAREGIAKGRLGLPPERVGEIVHTALTARRPRVRYVVTPTPFQQWLVDVLPKRVIDRLVARRLGWR